MAKRAKVEPTYLRDGASMTIGLHDIVKAVQFIENHGLSAKFMRAAKKKKAFATIESAAVNFVKDFFVANALHEEPIGRHIVKPRDDRRDLEMVRGAPRRMETAAARDRFDCDFG